MPTWVFVPAHPYPYMFVGTKEKYISFITKFR